MVESKDRQTGMYRLEFTVADPEIVKKKIEENITIKQKYKGNRVIRYIADIDRQTADIRVMQTRLVILTLSAEAIQKLKAFFL